MANIRSCVQASPESSLSRLGTEKDVISLAAVKIVVGLGCPESSEIAVTRLTSTHRSPAPAMGPPDQTWNCPEN
jgi:hypothetical protein